MRFHQNASTGIHLQFALKVLLLSAVSVLPATAQLIVSELYRDPVGREGDIGGGKSHEFIELINLGPDSLSIDALFITNGAEANQIIPISDSLPGHEACLYNRKNIPSGAAAVVLDPDYRMAINEKSESRFDLPAGTMLFTIDDNEFGSNGFTGDNGVVIYRGTRERIDSVLCTAADPGTNLQKPDGQKVLLSDPVNREGYSVVATSVLSASPQYKRCSNFISPGTFEPLKNGWIAEWQLGNYDRTNETVQCSISVLDASGEVTDEIDWFLEATTPEQQQRVLSGSIELSNHRDSIYTISFSIPIDSAQFSFILDTQDRPAWDIDLSTVWLPSSSIRITEIFPKQTSGEPEWFEVMNVSSMRINLSNWLFGNSEDTTTITDITTYIDPKGFTVITKDRETLQSRYRGLKNVIQPSVWHALGNSRDIIILMDGTGTLRETVCYDAAWFDSWPYLSLERNDNLDGCSKQSWCVASRATPEKPNTALYWRRTATPSLEIGPIPFITRGCSDDNRLTMRFSLPAAARASIDIYGFDGRIIHHIADINQETVTWNGCGTNGPAPPGPFFVVAEIVSDDTVKRIRKKGVLWRK